MIASGGLSGGLSSAIAGGNFWSGVREGLITSGLNHAMHSVVDGNENEVSTVDDKTNNGEIFNLFDPALPYDKKLINYMSNLTPEENTIIIGAHGASEYINGMKPDELNDYLMNNSKLYKKSITNGIEITIKLIVCSSAKSNDLNGSAFALSKQNRYANIIGASDLLTVSSKYGLGIKTGATWYNFKNGTK